MTDLREDSFGLLIAYVVPGFLWLLQLSAFSEPLQQWLSAEPSAAPTIAGFLFATIASVGAGLTASTLRWLTVDTLHHWTGVRPTPWTFRQLQANIDAFLAAVQYHYRYYQFYGNTAVVILCGTLVHRGPGTMIGLPEMPAILTDLGLIVLFVFASRDSLQKYYRHTGELLKPNTPEHSH